MRSCYAMNNASQWVIYVKDIRGSPRSASGYTKNHSLSTLTSSTLHKKWSFPLWISSVHTTKSAETADLVTFAEEILNGKLHFLCSAISFFLSGWLSFLLQKSVEQCMVFDSRCIKEWKETKIAKIYGKTKFVTISLAISCLPLNTSVHIVLYKSNPTKILSFLYLTHFSFFNSKFSF